MTRFWIGFMVLVGIFVATAMPYTAAAEEPPSYRTYLPLTQRPDNILSQLEGLVMSTQGSGTDLYTVSADGSRQTQLTTMGTIIPYPLPEWSPDGEWVMFLAGTPMKYDLYFVRHDGTDLHSLNAIYGNKFYAQWSPDGQSVLFGMRTDSGQTQLYLSTVDGTIAIPLGQPHTMDRPTWSPDGQHIAFTVYDHNEPHVVLLNRTTGAEQPLTDAGAALYFQGWLEGGARLIVSRETDGGLQGDLYLWNRDGSGATPFTTMWGREEVLSVEPGGTRVLYFTSRTTGLEQINLYLQGVNETTPTEVANSLCYGYHCGVTDISWSPNAGVLAYTRWLALDETQSESVVELVQLNDPAKASSALNNADLPLWLDTSHLAVRHYSGTWDDPSWRASLLNLATGTDRTLGPTDGKATLVAWRPR